VNAASMVPERVEEELFGSVSDDGQTKTGLLEKAHNGTLYLDEVADMPMETQGKLLRLLVEQRFQRLGDLDDVQVDVRVITSTSRDLEFLCWYHILLKDWRTPRGFLHAKLEGMLWRPCKRMIGQEMCAN